MIKEPTFKSRDERLEWIYAHKNDLISMKKMQVKHADACGGFLILPENNEIIKGIDGVRPFNSFKSGQIGVSAVINTTNILDSHGDVHLDNLWNKSLKETKFVYLNNNHKRDFENIISNKVEAYVVNTTFKALGYNFDGTTQALVFNAIIDEKSPYDNDKKTPLYDAYKSGNINNHSVEMQYKDILLGINDKRYPENKEIFDTYIKYAKNITPDMYDEIDDVWFVKQAHVMGGAAVPHGSNAYTPTLEVEQSQDIQDSEKGIHQEQPFDIEKFKNLLF